jgi:acyl-CoA reductase-like NAD-dependent aldehyde dehydrogenase
MATQKTSDDLPSVPLLIGGEPVATQQWLDVMNPAAPSKSVGRVALADQGLTRRAIDAAYTASKRWGALAPKERAKMLIDALAPLEAMRGEVATAISLENGKVVGEGAVDLIVFMGRTRLAASLAAELESPQLIPRAEGAAVPPGAPKHRTEVSHLPLGVVSIVVPFNWPLAILSASLPYALIAGNSVIVKPPPTAPIGISKVLHALAKGLPPGVLSVVSGSNEAVAPLIADPRIGRAVFTGSTLAGRAIMQLASTHLTPVTLELGGNDPALVLEDAALDRGGIEKISRACLLTSGQVCMAIKRIYVHESRYDELVEGMSTVLAEQKVGVGQDPTTTLGPLNTARQRDFVKLLCDEARAQGAEVKLFGTLDESAAAAGGHFLRPALVLNPSPTSRIVTEEQFGPAVPILKYTDVDRVIDQVNEEWGGLGSSVWTQDLERGGAIARRLRMGSTWLNNASAMAIDDRAPFGGFRQSGMGREMGIEGLREFTNAHTVTFPA